MPAGTLSTAQLAAYRAVAQGSLDQTATIARRTGSTGSAGQPSATYTTIASSVPCSLATPSASLLEEFADAVGAAQTWLVRFPASQDVQRDDQITVAGNTYRVEAVLDRKSWLISQQALCAEVR